jgi:hypothetical protein
MAEQPRDLSLLDLDFSLEVTGFEMGEIDLRIKGVTDASEGPPPAMRCLSAGGGPAAYGVRVFGSDKG